MSSTANPSTQQEKFVFWLHFVLVVIAWTGPFVFPWSWMVVGYGIVVAQFIYYNRCLMNQAHGLDETAGDQTFYSHLFEKLGFQPNRRQLKTIIRKYLYIVLAIATVILQVGLGYQPFLG